MSNNIEVPHPVIIFVRGLPGSGKSFLTTQLQKTLVHDGDDVLVLDPDAIDFDSEKYAQHVNKLTHKGVNPSLFAYRFLRGQAYEAIADRRIVIWNQPFTNLDIFHKMVANLRLQASEHKLDLPILVVEVEIDPASAKERVNTRKSQGGHGPSDSTFNRFTQDYRSFHDAGYDTISVRGDDEISKSVQNVVNALTSMLEEKN